MGRNSTFPCNASFLGKLFQNWQSNGNWIGLPARLLPDARNKVELAFLSALSSSGSMNK
jgi:hypothetical protein